MPKRTRPRPVGPSPIQLPLFPDSASLSRIRPDRNEWRFYRMEVWPDLFGRALLLRQWGVSAPRDGDGWIRIPILAPSMRSAASPGASDAGATRTAAYEQIAAPEAGHAFQACAAATGWHGAAHR
jgi:hypothetical protein